MGRGIRGGTVYLVGAGPGDPGLLTLRGREILTTADTVIYDRLANPILLAMARPDATLVDVGKTPGRHAMTQGQINQAIVEAAASGSAVCRLKGGDPFVFGRGGEEALACLEAGLHYEVVPGVSSAIAAAAYAGIPVTHRAVATSFAVITGHEDPSKPETQVDWEGLAHGADTLVFLMGIGNLPEITQQLIAHGRSPATPAAVVRWGTLPCQQVVEGTLGTIAELVAQARLSPPAVTIIGQVAGLRGELAWWEEQPLFGRRIVVTRARDQASDLVDLITAHGGTAIELPCQRVEALDVSERLRALFTPGLKADWLVFTSSNAVRIFFAALDTLALDSRALAGCRLGAVGSATAEALAAVGLRADFVPSSYSASDFAYQVADPGGQRFLLPGAAEASPDLAAGLTARGAVVEALAIYRTVPESVDAAPVAADLAAGTVDAITFASSGTVRQFRALLPEAKLDGVCLAAIGPRTAATMRELGLEPTVVANESRVTSLVEALVAKLGQVG